MIKIFEDYNYIHKYKVNDYVMVKKDSEVFNNNIFQIIELIPHGAYHLIIPSFINDYDGIIQVSEWQIIKKIEDYEIEAMKYNL
jgi:hypothetical protein